MPSLQRFAPTIRGTHAGPFNDRCGSVTYSERCDFGCGSIASVWPDHGDFRYTPVNGPPQDGRACLTKVPISEVTRSRSIKPHRSEYRPVRPAFSYRRTARADCGT